MKSFLPFHSFPSPRLFLPILLLGFGLASLSAQAQKASIADTAKQDDKLALKSFVAAVEKAGLTDTLAGKDEFTVFAPNDEAFKALGKLEDLPKDTLVRVLKNHVVKGKTNLGVALASGNATSLLGTDLVVAIEGGGIQVGGANIKKANVDCANGYLNIIDKVLMPASRSLKDVAKDAGIDKLLAAIETAGLTKTIEGKGPITIFAPSNEALEKAGEIDKDKLADILKNHVVEGKITAADLVAGKSFKTLAGNELKGGFDEGIKVAGIPVTKPDLEGENGVIHIIDGVIVPKPKSVADYAAELVSQSVEMGARLYNGKNPSATVDLYELTYHALLHLNPEAMPKDLPAALEKASNAPGRCARVSTPPTNFSSRINVERDGQRPAKPRSGNLGRRLRRLPLQIRAAAPQGSHGRAGRGPGDHAGRRQRTRPLRRTGRYQVLVARHPAQQDRRLHPQGGARTPD